MNVSKTENDVSGLETKPVELQVIQDVMLSGQNNKPNNPSKLKTHTGQVAVAKGGNSCSVDDNPVLVKIEARDEKCRNSASYISEDNGSTLDTGKLENPSMECGEDVDFERVIVQTQQHLRESGIDKKALDHTIDSADDSSKDFLTTEDLELEGSHGHTSHVDAPEGSHGHTSHIDAPEGSHGHTSHIDSPEGSHGFTSHIDAPEGSHGHTSHIDSPEGSHSHTSHVDAPEGSHGHTSHVDAPEGSLVPPSQPRVKECNCQQCHEVKSFNSKSKSTKHIGTPTTGGKLLDWDHWQKSFSNSCGPEPDKIKHSGSIGDKPFECSQCAKSFRRKHDLATHFKSNAHKNFIQKDRPFKCSKCEKSFTRKFHLERHIKTHKTGLRSGKRYTIMATSLKFKCNQCHRSFPGKTSLKSHMITHEGEEPFECNQCHKRFSQKDCLQRHMKVHVVEKRFKCNLCEKSFDYNCLLQAHIRTHTGEKPFPCNLCEKSFRDNCLLQAHIRSHTGKKPFTCSQCQKSFSLKSNLRKHEQKHTVKTGEQPAEKKPHRCDECFKSFKLKSTLKIHLLIHTGEKPHSCNVCFKSFSQKSAIKTHMLIHTGEKPFKCNLCLMTFRQNNGLKLHMKSHHGEEKRFKGTKCDESDPHDMKSDSYTIQDSNSLNFKNFSRNYKDMMKAQRGKKSQESSPSNALVWTYSDMGEHSNSNHGL